MIILRNVSLYYDQNPGIENLSLSFEEGKLHFLVGLNGAGKSTLLRVISALYVDYMGSALMDEREVKRHATLIKSQCGYAPEDPELPSFLTVEEFLSFVAGLKKEVTDEQIVRIKKVLGLNALSLRLVDDLSHGQKQKVALAAALMGKPRYLLLDETLNGLDALALVRLRDYLQELIQEGVTVVIASHMLPLVSYWAQKVTLLFKGRHCRVLEDPSQFRDPDQLAQRLLENFE